MELDVNKHLRQRRPVNVTIDQQLVKDAKDQGVNLSQAAEEGVRKALAEKWLEDNAEAIKSVNDWVDKNGLPLEKYRMF